MEISLSLTFKKDILQKDILQENINGKGVKTETVS